MLAALDKGFSVFVSYRREDSPGHAGRIRDGLVAKFGEDHVFFDLASVKGGVAFEQVIHQEIAESGVVLAVVGPRWSRIGLVNWMTRRRDWAAIELAHARELRKPVLPLLVGGALPKTLRSTPPALRYLAEINCFMLRDESWDDDIERLVDLLPDVQPGPQIPKAEPRTNRARTRMIAAAGSVAAASLTGAWLLMSRPDPRAENRQAPNPHVEKLCNEIFARANQFRDINKTNNLTPTELFHLFNALPNAYPPPLAFSSSYPEFEERSISTLVGELEGSTLGDTTVGPLASTIRKEHEIALANYRAGDRVKAIEALQRQAKSLIECRETFEATR
jgi:hypothetical protein